MADPPIKVDYNHELKPLEDALAGVERPGDFYVAGRLKLPMPTVKVDGVGILSFPVPPFQVEQLIEHATPRHPRAVWTRHTNRRRHRCAAGLAGSGEPCVGWREVVLTCPQWLYQLLRESEVHG